MYKQTSTEKEMYNIHSLISNLAVPYSSSQKIVVKCLHINTWWVDDNGDDYDYGDDDDDDDNDEEDDGDDEDD